MDVLSADHERDRDPSLDSTPFFRPKPDGDLNPAGEAGWYLQREREKRGRDLDAGQRSDRHPSLSCGSHREGRPDPPAAAPRGPRDGRHLWRIYGLRARAPGHALCRLPAASAGCPRPGASGRSGAAIERQDPQVRQDAAFPALQHQGLSRRCRRRHRLLLRRHSPFRRRQAGYCSQCRLRRQARRWSRA